MFNYRKFDDVFETIEFPAGEPHIKIKDKHSFFTSDVIEVKARNFQDLALLQVANNLAKFNRHKLLWYVPYFPFARQDRRINPYDGFEAKVALDMVKDLDIVISDPHSELTSQLPHHAQSETFKVFKNRGAFPENSIYIIPDAGAAKKAVANLKHLPPGTPSIQCLKHRDPHTGVLSNFEVLADDLKGSPCIVVDDICDGGGTFLGIANKLKEKNAGDLTLIVTHGLFTRGTSVLEENFSQILGFGNTNLNNDKVKLLSYSKLYRNGNIQ